MKLINRNYFCEEWYDYDDWPVLFQLRMLLNLI